MPATQPPAAVAARAPRRRRHRCRVLSAVLAPMVAVAAGCSAFKDDRGIGDAAADQQPDRPVKVWPAPDKFMNVGAFCIGENGIYIHTREAPPVVVADDPNCDEGGVLYDPESAG
ncbi:MAG TPA: hypothetical protein VIL36_23140 [Acidimicrobiales bacterium]